MGLSLFIAVLLLTGCASTGPKVSRQERQRKEAEFNVKFYQATKSWYPRIYRVGYQLVRSHVPGHGSEEPKYNFVGVGVEELEKYNRKVFGIPSSVKGLVVLDLYPRSRAEKTDLKRGDVITKLHGKKTAKLRHYFKQVRRARDGLIEATVWRSGETLQRTLPVEKVYYNAQFFLSATPSFEANSLFSKIHVGIGAIRYSRNDDELAVIMGHELAHTTLKHSLKKLGVSTSTAVAYGLVAGLIDAFTFPGVGHALIYPAERATEALVSRRYEREADYFGMQHAFHAGFDVGSGARIFGRLAVDAPNFQIFAYAFDTHPKWAERVLRLERIVEEFKEKYPDRFPLTPGPDWEIHLSVQPGETLEEAVNRLLQEEKKPAPPLVPAAAPPA